MDDISRRRFLRDASVGAVALGAVATVGRGTIGKLVKPSAAGTATAAMAAASSRDAENTDDEVMAHVIGGPTGKIEIYSGTSVVTLHNVGMANALLGALRS